MDMKNKQAIITLFAGILSIIQINISAQPNLNEKQLEDWQNRRFGMFIHWGPVSIKGYELSWARGSKLSIDEYENLYKEFDPADFNADEWVKVAKAAGMKYMVLTAKHHDGFCLWNTRQTDYNIMNTPFKRDVVKELSEACNKHGMKLGLYYSVCDWHQPDFPLIGYLPENASPEIEKMVKRDKYNLDAYTTYLKKQLAELLVNYGPIYVLWFDVPQMFDEKRGQGVIDFVRQIQPDIIVNNRSGAPGDYDTPEQHVGGFSQNRPFETCMTIAEQWGWKPDDDLKSFEQLMHILIRSAGGNGNFLLNIGPMGNGQFEKIQTDRLSEMGTWLQEYGHTVYETRGGPFLPADWGVSTYSGNTIYIHILKWMGKSPKIIIPDFGMEIQSCRLLNNDAPVKISRQDNKNVIQFSGKALDTVNTIIELKINGNPSDVKPIRLESQSISYKQKVVVSKAPDLWWNAVENINNGDWALPWIPAKDDERPWAEIDFSKPSKVSKLLISEKGQAIQSFNIQCLVNDAWITVHEGKSIGPELEVNLKGIMTQKMRLVLTEFSEYPGIYEIRVY